MNDFILEELTEGLTVKLPARALRSGTDSLLLAGLLPKEPSARALELGAGYGTVSLLAAYRGKSAEIDAVERQAALFSCLQENVLRNSSVLKARVRPVFADIRRFAPEDRYESVFANPPYYEAGSGLLGGVPERDEAKHELHGTILDFSLTAARLLKQGGTFYTVFPLARREALERALEAAGLGGGRMITVLPSSGEKGKLFLRSSVLGLKAEPVFECFCLFRDHTHKAPSLEAERLFKTGFL